jgi:hypothetical protein
MNEKTLTQFFDENQFEYDSKHSLKHTEELEKIITHHNSSTIFKLKKELKQLNHAHKKFEQQKQKYHDCLHLTIKYEKLMELSDEEIKILNSNNQTTKKITWNYSSLKDPYWRNISPVEDRSHKLFYDKNFFKKESTSFSEFKIGKYRNLIEELGKKSGDELTTRLHDILKLLENNRSMNSKNYFERASNQTYAGKIMEKILKRKVNEEEYNAFLQGEKPLFTAYFTKKRSIPMYNNEQEIINYEEKELQEALFIDTKSEKGYRLGFIEKNNETI